MLELAALLKLLSVFAHDAHNMVARVPFFQDHEFLGEIYATYDDDYDSVIERMLGLKDCCEVDFIAIHKDVAEHRTKLPCHEVKQNSEFFHVLLQLEQALCKKIAELTPECSIGTQQMIGDIADRSEQRQYKMKQRLKHG